MNYWLFSIPFISALTGWIIQQLFLRYLFHPQKPKKIAGITVQGIIPKQQKLLALQIGQLVSSELARFDLEKKISDPASFQKISPMIEQHVDDFLRNKLPEQMPMISMFVGEKTIQTMKTVFMKELESLFPEVMKQFAGTIQSDINPEKMIAEKIEAFPPAKLEQMLASPIRIFSAAGAIIGFGTGLVQIIFFLIINTK